MSAASVPVVSLNNMTVDGVAFEALFLPSNGNVREVGDSLECTVPCGFAVQEAAFSFTVSAPGYVSRTVAAEMAPIRRSEETALAVLSS